MTFEVQTKFEELRDKRLPVALSKIALLGNLGRSSYRATDAQKRDVVDQLQSAVDGLRDDYKLPTPERALVEKYRETYGRFDQVPPKPTRVPQGTAEGGASFDSEVRWALDAIRRGDTELAANRLERCLTSET